MRRFFSKKMLLATLLGLMSAGAVFAQDFGGSQAANIGGGALGTTDIRDVIVNVVNIALGFLGIIAVIIIIYGGWVWMTAGGNSDRVDQAKRILRNAVIGLAIILASWAITQFVVRQLSGATGGSLTCAVVGQTYACNGGCGDFVCQAGNIPGPCIPNGTCGPIGGGGLRVTGYYPQATLNQNVCLNTIIFATFNEVINETTVAGNMVLEQCSDSTCSSIVATVSPSIVTSLDQFGNPSATVEFIPSSPLVASATYRVTVQSDAFAGTGIAAQSGNRLAGNFPWMFTSGTSQDLTPPTVLVTSIVPPHLDTNVCLETFLGAEFDEVMRPSTLTGSAITVASPSGGTVPTYSVYPQYLPSSVYLAAPHHAIIADRPNPIHSINETYTVRIEPTVEDACQNALAQPFGTPGGSQPWQFDTGATIQCLPQITGVVGTGFYEAASGDQVVISGRYLTPFQNAVFGGNAGVISNTCLRPVPNAFDATNACLQSASPLSVVTQLPSGAAVNQGARDGTIRVTTGSGSATSPSLFDVRAPFISSINTGKTNGSLPAVSLGGFVSIFGSSFAQFPNPPQVWFTEVGNTSNRVQASFPCGTGSNTDTQIIAAFPTSFSGTLGANYFVQVEITDASGVVRHSNVGQLFLNSGGATPGLCSISPTSGSVGAGITVNGSLFTLFGTPSVQFGQPGNAVSAVGNPATLAIGGGPGGLDQATGVNVPSIKAQQGVGVFITDGTLTTNSVQFDVLGSGSGGPVIYDFTPGSGGTGQYVTISGTNFGQTKGSGDVKFYDTAGDVIGSTGFSISGDFASFPAQCQSAIWTNTQIIVKVPPGMPTGNFYVAVDTISGVGTSENLTNPRFNRSNAQPTPGICAMTPANGVAGNRIDIYGDNFGGVVDTVEFFNSSAPVNAPNIFGWSTQFIDDAEVPTGVETGPAHVYVGIAKSNPFLFTAGLCNDPGAGVSCFSGSTCCSGGVFDGQCRVDIAPGIDSCSVQQYTSAMSWSFISGVGPGTSCDLDPVAPLCQPDNTRCNGSNLVCEQSSCTCQPFGIVFNTDCSLVNQSPSPRPGEPQACTNSQLNVQFNDSIDITPQNLARIVLEQCGAGSTIGNCVGTPTAVPTNKIPTQTVIPNDTVLINPQVILVADTVYRATIPQTFLSQGGAPFPKSYSWYFKTDTTGAACQPDNCSIAPPSGGGVSSLFAPNNIQSYTLSSARACNLILGNFTYDITSGDTSVGVPTNPLNGAPLATLTTNLTSVPVIDMTAVGGGSTNVTAQNTIDTTLLCRAPFTVSTIVPRVVNAFPSCNAACINSVIGVSFSTDIVKSDIRASNPIVYPVGPPVFDTMYLQYCGVYGGAIPPSCDPNNFWIGAGPLDSTTLTWDDAGPVSDKFTIAYSGGPLAPNSLYRVVLFASHIHSASGEKLVPNDPNLAANSGFPPNFTFYTWQFSTKSGIGTNALCEPAYIQLSPANVTVHAVGQSVPFTGAVYGTLDECNPTTGQQLNAFDFDWQAGGLPPNGWNSSLPGVATIQFPSSPNPPYLADLLPPPPAGPDGLADPTQYALTTGIDPSCVSGSCSTTINGSLLTSTNVLNSTAGSPARSATLTLQCGYQTDAQCATVNSDPRYGVTNNTCCGLRPALLSSNPVEGAVGICRNIKPQMTFNIPIDANSALGNIFLAENVGFAACAPGANSLLVLADDGSTFLRTIPDTLIGRLVQAITTFIRSLFGTDASAQAFYSPGQNLCIVPSKVSVVPASAGGSDIFVSPSQALTANKNYVLVVLGDDNASDGVKRGLQSVSGVTLVGSTPLAKGGVTYNAELVTFQTGANVCDIAEVRHMFYTGAQTPTGFVSDQKTSHTFFCARDDCSTDLGNLPGAPLPSVVTSRAGNQHYVLLDAIDASGNHVTANYEWLKNGPNFYETCPVDPSGSLSCILANTNSSGGFEQYGSELRVDDSLGGFSSDASGQLTVTAKNTLKPSNAVSSSLTIRLFTCNNPWPDINNFPYSDSATNCLPATGACQDTNFEFYYCRDAGGPGTSDDLPALNVTSPVVTGQSQVVAGGTTGKICYGGSNPTVECTNSNPDCLCVAGDTSCEANGVCAPAELKNLVFPREGIPTPPPFSLGLPTTPTAQGGGEVAVTYTTAAGFGYKVYWGLSPTSLTSSKDVGIAATGGAKTALVQNLDPTKTYYFAMTTYVRSPYGGAESNQSGTQSFIGSDIVPPLAPVITGAVAGSGQVTIQWQPEQTTAFDVANFRVHVGISGSGTFPQSVLVGKVTSHVFSLTPGTTYAFRMEALDAAGNNSVFSNVITGTPQ